MENTTQTNIQPVHPLSQPPIPVSPSPNRSRAPLFILLGIIIVVGVVFVGIQLGKEQLSDQQSIFEQPKLPTQIVANPTASKVPAEQSRIINSTENWEIYTNSSAGFSIRYPSGWRKVESTNQTGFGPQEIGEDVVLGVTFYNKSEKTIAQIKDDAGKQFPDRTQTEEIISLNGLPAIKVITTTKKYEDWYSVSIIIDSGDKLYAIGNGAQTDKTLNEMVAKITGKSSSVSFEDFYMSFRISQ